MDELRGQRGKKKQANFLLPERLLDELRRLVPAKQRSMVVATALERELSRMRVREALEEHFGSWRREGGR